MDEPGRGARGRWPLVCGLLAGLLQANFLLELVLPGRLPVSTSLVSELSATGQPYAWAYRTADLLAALLTLEVARLVAGRPRSALAAVTGALVAAYAVGLGVSALVSTSCADSLGRCGGHQLFEAGARLQDRVHDLTSIVSALGLLASAATGAVLLRRRGRRRRAALLAGAGVLATLLGAVALLQLWTGADEGQGLVQRGQVALSSCLVVLLAEGLGRRAAAPGPVAVATGPGLVSPRRRPSRPGC